jgi:hypothetical protein
MENHQYLVRVNDTRFLVESTVDGVTVTDTPSSAKACPYAVADAWVRRLRARGFPASVITDIFGTVMTYTRIKSELRAIESGKAQDDLPNTLKELSRIPVKEQRRRYRTDPKFAERLDALETGK